MTILDAERRLREGADPVDSPPWQELRAPLDERIRDEAGGRHRSRDPRRAFGRVRQGLSARAHGLGRQHRPVAAAGAAMPLLLGGALLLAGWTRLGALMAAGAWSFGRYDDGVHFAAAIQLVHGVLPYRDALLLQPPGIVVLLAPFAALGGWLGDGASFVLARGAFTALGVLNTALVWAVLRRAVPGTTAAACGAVLYALSPAAVYVEQSTLLEVPGTTAVLAALLLLLRASLAEHGGPLAGLAGAVAGAGVGVKIWYLVPALVLLLWARGHRVAFALGAVAAALAVYLPFFLRAPAAMWQQVVLAQLGRPRSSIGSERRLASLLGLDGSQGTLATVLLVLLAVLALLSLLGGTSVLAALVAATGAVLLAGPSFFQHYTALTAAPLALVAGAGVGRAAVLIGGGRAAAVTGIATLAAALAIDLPHVADAHSGRPLAVAPLRAATAQIPGCVVADDPTVLILIDRFGPDIARGCEEQVDLSGRGYVDLPEGTSVPPPRPRNPAFQRAALRYLRGAQGYVLARGDGLGLSAASSAAVRDDHPLFEQNQVVLRVPHQAS